MAKKKVKATPKKRNGKAVKAEVPKRDRTFKKRVVGPGELVKIQVDHKTWLYIDKNKNPEDAKKTYQDRQARALKQLKK